MCPGQPSVEHAALDTAFDNARGVQRQWSVEHDPTPNSLTPSVFDADIQHTAQGSSRWLTSRRADMSDPTSLVLLLLPVAGRSDWYLP